MGKDEKLILLDADVVIHFIKGGRIFLLPKLFQHKKVILDIVVKELLSIPKFRGEVETLLNTKVFKQMNFPMETDIFREYASLKRNFGNGESACMAVCRFKKNILASSNLRDIKVYCQEHDIQFLTTMDFLYEAYSSKELTEAECDYFIYEVTSKNSRLPCDTIKRYIEKYRS